MSAEPATKPLQQLADDDDDDLSTQMKQQRRRQHNGSSSSPQSIPLSCTNINIDISHPASLLAAQKVSQHVAIDYDDNLKGTLASRGKKNLNELGLQKEGVQATWKSLQTNNAPSRSDINSRDHCSDQPINNLTLTTSDKRLGNIATAAEQITQIGTLTTSSVDPIRSGESGAATSETFNRPSQPIHYYNQPSSVLINSRSHNHQSVESSLRFKSLLASSSIPESDEHEEFDSHQQQTALRPYANPAVRCERLDTIDEGDCIIEEGDEEISLNGQSRYGDDDDYNSLSEDELYVNESECRNNRGGERLLRLHNRSANRRQLRRSVSFERLKSSFKWRVVNLLFGSGSKGKGGLLGSSSKAARSPVSNDNDHQLYATHSEDKDLLTGTSKYHSHGKRRKQIPLAKTFRGSYKYSRAKITMAILNKIGNLMTHPSTLALLGAFLIHITLGTVYTLSNINSYMTSYMRKHGSPHATYGGAMWISSSYAVGQGLSMVLGGYIEKRFSARLSCFIGCALHSLSTIATSKSMDHGPLAVLLTYGFIPGFGCGLAYMTPMSNGFGWFPNRKGLVAGVILAGFGIGTFVFNMAQTAYVNPNNLSPPDDASGYFTQETILNKVPHLFVFIGCIYAAMQFLGCCLLFKPPNPYLSGADTVRPILVETEMPLKQSIRRREFYVLFLVYGITTPGILFVNSMLKEYGQIFIGDDMYLAWTGSMGSIANAAGRLGWGLAIDKFSFTQCFTSITVIFGTLMLLMPFEFILSSKLFYLLCTLGIFGSFSGWMSTYPVHLSRVFGRTNSGMIYGLIFMSQVSTAPKTCGVTCPKC